MSRPTAGAFFLGDLAFLQDAKFRKLARRLPEPDEFNSAVGAYFIALAVSRRNGHSEIDARAETDSRFVDDLVAVGLMTEDGFPSKAWEAWRPQRPAEWSAPGGKKRAANAQRGPDGRLLSRSPASSTASADQRTLGVLDQREPAHAGAVQRSQPSSAGQTQRSQRVQPNRIEESRGESRESESQTPTVVPARDNGRSREHEPRLTKEQLEAWGTFSAPEWQPFKAAWLARRLLLPPFGEPGDDPGTSQRTRLWRIADARPNDLGEWVAAAPGRKARDVITYVFEQWAKLEEDVADIEAATVAEQDEAKAGRRPMARLGDVLAGMEFARDLKANGP